MTSSGHRRSLPVTASNGSAPTGNQRWWPTTSTPSSSARPTPCTTHRPWRRSRRANTCWSTSPWRSTWTKALRWPQRPQRPVWCCAWATCGVTATRSSNYGTASRRATSAGWCAPAGTASTPRGDRRVGSWTRTSQVAVRSSTWASTPSTPHDSSSVIRRHAGWWPLSVTPTATTTTTSTTTAWCSSTGPTGCVQWWRAVGGSRCSTGWRPTPRCTPPAVTPASGPSSRPPPRRPTTTNTAPCRCTPPRWPTS